MAVERWLADNYDAIVRDVNRTDTYETIAAHADVSASPELAAWARKRAAESGAAVTPRAARPTPKSRRAK